jgi:hypothetical protein
VAGGDERVVRWFERRRREEGGWLMVRRELCPPSMQLCGEITWTLEAPKEAAVEAGKWM